MPVDNNQRAPGVKQLTPEAHELFKYETNRLKTFSRWPESVAKISGDRLARAGFYYLGDKTGVQCFECGGRITEWKTGDIAHTQHRLLFPNCKFISGTSDNIPLVNSTGGSINSHHLYPSDDSGNSSDDSPPSISPTTMTSSSGDSSSSPYSSGDELLDLENGSQVRNGWNRASDGPGYRQSMRSEQNRLNSFNINGQSLWQVPGVSPDELARAGFHLLEDDRVQCAFCTGIIRNWSPDLRPLEEHSKHFPLCPFLMEEQVGNIPIGNDPILDPSLGYDVCGTGYMGNEQLNSEVVSTRGGNSVNGPIEMSQLGIQPYSGPKNPEMGPLESRKNSFINTGWNPSTPVSTDRLAEAGFYYIGYLDAVKCFHCDGGLAEWAQGDEPWIEHAKKFPTCSFLKLNKSQSFIQECQRQEQASSVQSNESANTGTDDITVCHIVDQWLASDLVRQLISMNQFSIDLIKATLNGRYYSCKKPFDSFAQLYSAVENLSDTRPKSRQSNENHINNDQTLLNHQSNGEQSNLSMSSINSTSTALLTTTTTAAQVVPQTSGKEKKPLNERESPLVCKICFLSEIEVVFLPCGHQLACSDCAQRLTDCPVCRQPIKGYVRTFFS